MKKNISEFSDSDAWVFASMILSFKNNDILNLRKIISAGDYLNHSILTLKELRSALVKFQKSGIIEISESRIKFMIIGKNLKRKCLKLRKGLVPNIETAFHVLNEKPITISNSESVYIIKASEYKTSLKEYLQN